jgi:hypothetical protein
MPALDDVKGSANVSSTTDIAEFCDFFDKAEKDGRIQGKSNCDSQNEDALSGGNNGGSNNGGSGSGSEPAAQPIVTVGYHERIPPLLDTAAAVRFLSCEPLLGPIDLMRIRDDRGCSCAGADDEWGHEPWCGTFSCLHEGELHWVIAGGESGPAATGWSHRGTVTAR